MSLLGSIFGGKKKEGEDGPSGNLFEKSSDLPERPSHVPKARPAKKRKDEELGEGDQKKKKQRKPKKVVEDPETTEEKDATTAAGDDDDKKKTSETDDAAVDDDKVKPNDEARTIFVGSLPLASTRKSLAALFKECGPIASTRIRSAPVKGIKLPPASKGNQNLMKKVCVNTQQLDETLKNTVQGYVVFKDEESVQKALDQNNQLVVDGRRLRIDRASPTVEPSRSVFCGNLPYAADEATLQEHFVKGCAFELGDVQGVRIIRDKDTFQCKGFGYVLLKEKSMIPAALKMHDTTYMKKNMRVLVCGKRFKGKKGDSKNVPAFKQSQPKEKTTVGAFRRILGSQTKEATVENKRKRGSKSKNKIPIKKSIVGLSKRQVMDKKVDMKVKKLEKRASKGMGKTRHK
jgi:nucleolar protein 12